MKKPCLVALLAVLALSPGAPRPVAAQASGPAAEEMRLLRFPAVHGDTVVFTYAADLWVADRKGGPARRLTSHPGEETAAKISPDGAQVAFLASYDGDPDVYVMPIGGGPPRRLTYDGTEEYLVGWTPEGKVAYASTAGSFTTRQQRLWLVDADGGLPEATPVMELGDGSFLPGSNRLVYTRSRFHTRNWRRYRGGNNGRIAVYDFRLGTYTELVGGRENSWFPMVIGDSLFYASDRDGTVNLYRRPLDGKGQEAQLTRFTEADLRRPVTDGKTIVYENDGYLRAYDIATGRDEKLTFAVQGDEIGARPYVLKVGKKIDNVALSAGGKRVAVEARGEILEIAANGKESWTRTGTPGVRERQPRWSPDGKSLAYLSDASGDYQIYLQPAAGGPGRQVGQHSGPAIEGLRWSPDSEWIASVTEDDRLAIVNVKTGASTAVVRAENGGGLTFDWSPDSRWIAYSSPGKNGFRAIYLYEVATGKSTRVTAGFYDDSNVAFDLNGKYLYFTSPRKLDPTPGRFEQSLKILGADVVCLLPLTKDLRNPLFPQAEPEGEKDAKEGKDSKDAKAEVRIDFEGLGERVVMLPLPAANEGYTLIGANNGVFAFQEGKLRKFDLASQETSMIYDGSPEVLMSFNADRSRLAYFEQETLGVAETKAGQKPGTGKIDTAALEVRVDPRAEWRQMFWEAWRFERNNYYRADMGGLDWQAVGKRYEKYLPSVAHRRDLDYVFGLMLGELSTSHAYVYPEPAEPGVAERAAKAALLGADYERGGPGDRYVRFARVYRGSLTLEGARGPLGEPGINVEPGDYLLEIDGQPVDASINPGALLINKAGRVVTLTVNGKPMLDGARRVQVRPIPNEADLRYYEWVEENRRKVDKLSGGRIGYIHYPNTSEGGQKEFIRGYYAQTDKDALILDERWNSGGNPQPMVLPTLARRRQTVSVYRRWGVGGEILAINGPKAMLINDYAGSGGDLTPWMWRDSGMGALIGTRTFGGLVGISAMTDLMDGGRVSAPSHARFDPRTGQQIAENVGIEPDIEVDLRPDLLAKGQDPQLEAAVKYLLEQLEKNPVKDAAPKFELPRP